MNLKEAFRYQNFLDNTLNTLIGMLRSPQNTQQVLQVHHRNKVNPDVEDESLDATPDRPFDCSVDALIDICDILIVEKTNISIAIDHAKQAYREATGFSLDAEMAVNKHRQALSTVLRMLGNRKATKRVTTGTSYKFNAEGNQTPYFYEIDECTQPSYEVQHAKDMARVYSNTADAMSNRADSCLIASSVLFTPLFDVNDSIAEVIERGYNVLTEKIVGEIND